MAKDPLENLRREAERTRRQEEAAAKREQARAAKEADKAAKEAEKAAKEAEKAAKAEAKKAAKAAKSGKGRTPDTAIAPGAEPAADVEARPVASAAAAAAAAARKKPEPPPEVPTHDEPVTLPPASVAPVVVLPPAGAEEPQAGEKRAIPKAGAYLVGGFKDRSSRPRFIIWTGVSVLLFAVFMILALGATSTYWFCANVCHKVQDDTIIAYGRSSHSEVSCMACHEPVNAHPLEFILAKAEALGELYLTATNQYELPLNADSHVAEEMSSEQCTQCHALDTRIVTPTYGLIIDHDIHEKNDVNCTQCHNRVAHREDFELTLTGPDGEPNEKHEDFISMEGCFRCHSQEPGGRATGDCYACHTKDFPLKPANHDEPGFYEKYGESSGHAKLSEERPAYCPTCHSKQFCTDCHGVVMPHPADFEKNHKQAGEEKPEVCANCHAGSAETAQGEEFCNSCHHKEGDPAKPWIPQHYEAVRKNGAQACFECHDPTFCARCHVRGTAR